MQYSNGKFSVHFVLYIILSDDFFVSVIDNMVIIYSVVAVVVVLLVTIGIILGVLKKKGIIGAGRGGGPASEQHAGVRTAWDDTSPINQDTPDRPRSVSSVKTNFGGDV